MPEIVALVLIDHWRPGPHKRHVAFQDVEKLGQFVKTGLPKKSADGRDSRIGDQFVGLLGTAAILLCGCRAGYELFHVLFVNARIVLEMHGPELQKRELLAVLSQPHLPVERRGPSMSA